MTTAEPLIEKLCRAIGVQPSPYAFNSTESYVAVERYLSRYSASTAENYIWRLCRYLKPHNLAIFDRYERLLLYYKEKYVKSWVSVVDPLPHPEAERIKVDDPLAFSKRLLGL